MVIFVLSWLDQYYAGEISRTPQANMSLQNAHSNDGCNASTLDNVTMLGVTKQSPQDQNPASPESAQLA